MKKILFLLLVFCSINSINGQVFYTEDFDGAACGLPGGSACDPSIIGWTIVSQGAEGATANRWYISDRESGVLPPGCGIGGTGNQTLHVGNVAGSTLAALSCINGDCGAAYDAGGPTEVANTRVESPTISCVGQSNITVDFNYIEGGQGVQDDCSFWYFDGAVWTSLDPIAKTISGAPCAPQGNWTNIVSINLPPSADNNANVQIGFLWVNDGDGAGADPSVAIDEVTLTSNPLGPTASFSSTDSNLCIGECIDFNDLSTGSPTAWTWYFPGSNTPTSTAQNPLNICYNGVGSFDVSLVADDGSTTDSLYLPNFIVVDTLPTVSANATSTSICAGSPVTLTGGGATSYSWDNGVTDGIAFNPLATILYTVTGTDVNSCQNTDTVTIFVDPCASPPVASFSASGTSLCPNDCVNFFDLSSGGVPTVWSWYFFEANPSTSNSQNPTNLCYDSTGTYDVALFVSNAFGTDSIFIANYITVDSCNAIPASIVIPTVLTPNGDGLNDLFNVTGNFTTLHMEIFNRWGALMYKSDLVNEGWNGRTTAGVEAIDGTYFYIITTDIELYKGSLTLIR